MVIQIYTLPASATAATTTTTTTTTKTTASAFLHIYSFRCLACWSQVSLRKGRTCWQGTAGMGLHDPPPRFAPIPLQETALMSCRMSYAMQGSVFLKSNAINLGQEVLVETTLVVTLELAIEFNFRYPKSTTSNQTWLLKPSNLQCHWFGNASSNVQNPFCIWSDKPTYILPLLFPFSHLLQGAFDAKNGSLKFNQNPRNWRAERWAMDVLLKNLTKKGWILWWDFWNHRKRGQIS